MPELPEVETTRRAIAPYFEQRRISDVIIRQHKLRWPIDSALTEQLPGQCIQGVTRRGKYILFTSTPGTLLLHLGMSGRVRIVSADCPPGKHDHVDIIGDDGRCLRFTDPRRFGAILWTQEDPLSHPRLRHLGPEPLSTAFNPTYLAKRLANRRTMIKASIMQGEVVVGVGNIYASESLFLAGIDPRRPSGSLTQVELKRLVQGIKKILRQAIKQGGTTLKDFYSADGQPGYFSLSFTSIRSPGANLLSLRYAAAMDTDSNAQHRVLP